MYIKIFGMSSFGLRHSITPNTVYKLVILCIKELRNFFIYEKGHKHASESVF